MTALILLAGCSNAPVADQKNTTVPPASAATTIDAGLPEAHLVGSRCVGDSCKLEDARQVNFGGETYTAESKIGYAKLGDVVAVAVGADVEKVEVRAITGVDPQIAIAVTGDGLNAVRYRQVSRIGRVGPAIVRLNPDDPFGGGASMAIGGFLDFDGSCIYLTDREASPGSRRLAVWPSGTVWHGPPRAELELRDGTLIAVGDLVSGGGAGGRLQRLLAQHGREIVDGCTQQDDGYLSFHFLPEVIAADVTEEMLVVERRPISSRERDRFDDDDLEGSVLDCEDYGGAVWDYGPIEDSPKRTQDEALLFALDDLDQEAINEGLFALAPRSGWLQLTDTDRRSTYVHDDSSWQIAILVLGDPELGIYRHAKAYRCSP